MRIHFLLRNDCKWLQIFHLFSHPRLKIIMTYILCYDFRRWMKNQVKYLRLFVNGKLTYLSTRAAFYVIQYEVLAGKCAYLWKVTLLPPGKFGQSYWVTKWLLMHLGILCVGGLCDAFRLMLCSARRQLLNMCVVSFSILLWLSTVGYSGNR